MTLKETLGGTRRVISKHTVVWEWTGNGAQVMTPLEQKMYNLLLELTDDGSSNTIDHHESKSGS
jgi:hypothetical protein